MAVSSIWQVGTETQYVPILLEALTKVVKNLLEERGIEITEADSETLKDGFAKTLKVQRYEDEIIEKTLTYLRRNPENFPIYIDEDGVYWLDIDCRKESNWEIYNCEDNDPDTEPWDPLDRKCKVTFVPERVIDPSKLKAMYGFVEP